LVVGLDEMTAPNVAVGKVEVDAASAGCPATTECIHQVRPLSQRLRVCVGVDIVEHRDRGSGCSVGGDWDRLGSPDEGGQVAGVTTKSFNLPDEQSTSAKTTADIVQLGTQHVARLTFQPGWHWSEHAGPAAGATSCQLRHVGTVQSGTMHVVHADGSEADVSVGDAYVFEPGHDAWVVGDYPVVVVEFESAAAYSRAPTAGIDIRGVPEND
jgi:hypothetical protein